MSRLSIRMVKAATFLALLVPAASALRTEKRGSPKELISTGFNAALATFHAEEPNKSPITIPFEEAEKTPATPLTPRELLSQSFNDALTTFHLDGVKQQATLDLWYTRWFIYGGGGLIGASLLWGLAALAYTRFKEDPRRLKDGAPEEVMGAFKHGIFDCAFDPQMTIIGTCCLPIRWADTMRLAGFLSFWPALCLIILVGPVLSILGIGTIALVVMLTYYRVELRRKFSMPIGVTSTVLDCLSVAFCMCCSVIQEARHVEAAHEAGHPIFNDKIPLRGDVA